MKWVRLEIDNESKYGILTGDVVKVVDGSPFADYTITTQELPLEVAKLLAPCQPSKVVCIGLNYRDHALEMKLTLPQEPLIFLKPPTTVIGPDAGIEYPQLTKDLQYEAELAVVIGKKARHVKAADALEYILGYTCANDVTARDLQKSDGQWTRGKSFDTFLPLGPFIETEIEPSSLDISLTLNGNIKQKSNTRQLIFPIPQLVEHVSAVMTLLPGDVIITGTPSGVGPMLHGDEVKVIVAGLGELVNKIM